jgi:tetratricopeptide (TPR) repeat protein
MSLSRNLVLASTVVMITMAAGTGRSLQKAPAPKDAQAVANKAIAELSAWNNAAARKTLQASKSKFGMTPELQTAWALLEAQEGESSTDPAAVTKGLKSLDQATKAAPADPAASYWRGEILYRQDKRTEAGAAWKAAEKSAGGAVKKDPNNATAQFYLGASLVRSKKYEDARKALRLAVRGGFDEPMVNHQIGLSYLFAEQWQEAKDAFDLGLSVDPRYAPMYFWRAMAWDKLGRKDNMLIDLDQYLKLAPKGPEAGKAEALLKAAGR